MANLAAFIANTPWAAVSIVGNDRIWLKAVLGELARDTPRQASFCGTCTTSTTALVVEDTARDARFSGYAWLAQGVRAYAGSPIVVDGEAIGAVCVMDRKPRHFPRRLRQGLELLAVEAGMQIRLRRQTLELEELLRAAAPTVRPTEQAPFDARLANVASHELNTPLTPILLQLAALRQANVPDATRRRQVECIERNVMRLAEVIQVILDEARRPTHTRPTPNSRHHAASAEKAAN